MENQQPDYQELLKRIHTIPSILFLGQNYLTEALSASATSEPSKNDDEAQCLHNYKEILSLKWNAILSSSYDANIPNKCGDSFSFEARFQYDKTQKINKTVNAGYFLFGQNSNGTIPSKPDLDLDSSSKDMFSAVLKKTIDAYGIIIISGWDFETDWITPKILYDVLKDAPEQSILLFGTQIEKALENKFIKELSKKQLLEKDIIEDSFYAFLQKNAFFDTRFETDNFSLDSNVETLSLYSDKYKNGRIPFVLSIQKDTIYELNSKSITIITDITGVNTVSKNNENLLRFCAYKGDWSYYAPHNKLVINRQVSTVKGPEDFYIHISKLIENITRKSKKKSNHYICVTGIHYSGKTASLKNFALRNKNKYPIFYVENYEEGQTEKFLSDVCSNLINLPEEFTREVIVICDFKVSSDYEMQKNCLKIKDILSEIPGIWPIVVGTIYSKYEFYKNQIKVVELSEKLGVEEQENIKSVYDFDLKFCQTTNNTSLFEIISRHYRFQFSPEAADLRATMNNAHSVNQDVTLSNVNVAYGQIYDEQFDNFIKKGILSSFKDSLDESNVREKEIKYNLKKLNDCIALASEFGIQLPINFVFRTLGWSNYRFLEALNADCFLIQIEDGFQYISAYEAGKYLLFNYTDDSEITQIKETKLKEKEVGIICNIIEICNWNDYVEASVVISLIRKFSPNSIGKDSNIIGRDDVNLDLRGKNWNYYNEYYEKIGSKILDYADNNSIAVVVASAFLRRSYQANNHTTNKSIDIAYDHCRAILNNNTLFEALSVNEKIEVYIEMCNVIITKFSSCNEQSRRDFDKWDEFTELFQGLVELYDKTDKLEASVILNIWHRAVEKKATKQNTKLFQQTMSYESTFLSDISLEYDFKDAIKKYESICNIYSADINVDSYKNSNLKGWLLYQQRYSYKLEPNDHILHKEEKALAKQILSVFNESEETRVAVLEQPLLLKTKILCDWIIKFGSLPYAEENPISFTDTVFWGDILKDINTYLALCNEKNPPAAFIKYIKCVYSLVFDDGSYLFEENVRYSKKLSPWYVKRIGVADENGKLLKFVIGTTPQRNKENFRGIISDSNSILKNLNYIHLSQEVQKYLSEGKIRLTATNSIVDKPVNIFFNAAGATAAIPRREGGDNE